MWVACENCSTRWRTKERTGDEHYGLNWPGKQAARKQATKAPTATLRLTPGEGVEEATTQNMLIVGDNLEVLRLLQKRLRRSA